MADPAPAAAAAASRTAPVVKCTKLEIPAALRGQFMDPAPTDLPRESVEVFLKQVDIQLKLTKSLADNVCLEDALKLQRLIHDRVKELSHLGDACIATWTTYGHQLDGMDEEEVARRKIWMQDSTLSAPMADETLKETQLSRWTQEEVDLFNLALAGVDLTKRGYPEEIRKIVKTRTVVQIRERLRRIKHGGTGKKKAASPTTTTTTTTTTPTS